MANPNLQKSTALLFVFYGVNLLVCGILSYLLLGMKAQTGMIAGLVSGFLALQIGHFMNQHKRWAFIEGLVVTLLLIGLFAWRTTKAFLFILTGGISRATQDIIPPLNPDKGIAFLLLAYMLIVSVITLAFQVMFIKENLSTQKV